MPSPHRWIVEFTAHYLLLVWGIAVLAACLGLVLKPTMTRVCALLEMDFGLPQTPQGSAQCGEQPADREG